MKDRVMEICGHALQPAGIILLVIGAGGVLNRCWWIPASAGAGQALTGWAAVAVTWLRAGGGGAYHSGSATVACLTAVVVMPVIEQLHFPAQMAALSICIAGGSTCGQPR
jgi:Gnt-I system low-affinity gluconate transporter